MSRDIVWLWVERSKVKVTGSVSTFITLMSEHNLKTNNLDVFKLGIGNWDILEITWFGGVKVTG